VGEYQKSLELVGENANLWSHALLVSNLVSRDAYNHTVHLFCNHVSVPSKADEKRLVESENKDPYVNALLTVYEIVSQTQSVADILSRRFATYSNEWISLTLIVYSLLGKNSKWSFLGEKFFTVF